MIVTVTPNPSLDRTLFVDELAPGAVHRARRSSSEPSGKGVNVSHALHAHGIQTRAVLPLGGPTGALLNSLLTVDTVVVPIAKDVRSNVSIVEPNGTVTKINEPGPFLDPPEVEAMMNAALHTDAEWLVCCGSLPPGVPDSFYADLVLATESKTAIDTSGVPLLRAISAAPDLIKPNVDELAAVTGRELRTIGDVIDAAQLLRTAGVGAVLASLGGDGALLVDARGVLHGEAPVTSVVSAVGAGDALLAGFLAGGGAGPDALASALRWAAAAVQHEGTLVTGSTVDTEVVLHQEADLHRQLRK